MTTSIARPDLARPLRVGLARLQRATGVDCAMGGLIDPSGLRLAITELHNARTNAFRGTVVTPGAGAGGQAMLLARPVAVADYLRSAAITHQYDRQAQAEQANGTFAVPVQAGSRIRAMIWGLTWTQRQFGDRTLESGARVAARLGQELAVEIEVTRRLTDIEDERRRCARRGPAFDPREIREELLSIADATSDPSVRDRLGVVCDRLRVPDRAGPDRSGHLGPLTPRECEVLVEVARGLTNNEIAERLTLMPTTVKSYLKNAMRKFGTRNRVETIHAARQAGLVL
jgi:DNA-binding CsgD family transcriptional regulator